MSKTLKDLFNNNSYTQINDDAQSVELDKLSNTDSDSDNNVQDQYEEILDSSTTFTSITPNTSLAPIQIQTTAIAGAPTNNVKSKFIENLKKVNESLNNVVKQKLKQEITQVINIETTSKLNDRETIENLKQLANILLNTFDSHLVQDLSPNAKPNNIPNNIYNANNYGYRIDQANDFAFAHELITLFHLIVTSNIPALQCAQHTNKIINTNELSQLLGEIDRVLLNNKQIPANDFRQKYPKEIAALEKIKAHFAPPVTLEDTISLLDKNLSELKTNIQTQESELPEQRNQFHQANNKLFIAIVTELLAYREHYQAELKLLEDEKKKIEKQTANPPYEQNKKKHQLEQLSERIAYREGFIFQIEHSLDHFLHIAGIKSDDKFKNAVIAKALDRFPVSGTTNEAILTQIQNSVARLNPVHSNGVTNNNHSHSNTISSPADLYSDEDFNQTHRKQFHALCNILKDARKNYDSGKSKVQAEFEKEKEKYENKAQKKLKTAPKLAAERTYFLGKNAKEHKAEKLLRKKIHLKVGDKHFEKYTSNDQTKNPLAGVRDISAQLANLDKKETPGQKDGGFRRTIENTKTKLQDDQREYNRIKRSLKIRIFSLIEDYQVSALKSDDTAAKHAIEALAVLLKMTPQEHPKFESLKKADLSKPENFLAVNKYIYHVAAKQGIVVPEFNPKMTLSKYACAKIQKTIEDLNSNNDSITIKQLRYLEEEFINKQMLIPDNIIKQLSTGSSNNNRIHSNGHTINNNNNNNGNNGNSNGNSNNNHNGNDKSEDEDNEAQQIAKNYNRGLKRLSAITYQTLQDGVDTMIDHPWQPILIPRFTESVTRSFTGKEFSISIPDISESIANRSLKFRKIRLLGYGIDRDLYEILLRIEQNTETVRSLKDKALQQFENTRYSNPRYIKNPTFFEADFNSFKKDLEFSTGLKELREKHFDAAAIESKARTLFKESTNYYKDEFEKRYKGELKKRYPSIAPKTIPKENKATIKNQIIDELIVSHHAEYQDALNTEKHLATEAFFADLIDRFFFLRDVAIKCLKDGESAPDFKANMLTPFVTAFNNLAEKVGYPHAFAIDEKTGEYAIDRCEHVTQQKIKERKLIRNVKAFSTFTAGVVTFGQVAAAFAGSLVYYALTYVSGSTMASVLLSFALPAIGVVSITATGIIFWPIFVIAATLMGSLFILAPLRKLHHVLRPIPIIGHISRAIYAIVSGELFGKIPVIGRLLRLPFRIVGAISRFAKKHPKIVMLAGTLGILASVVVFPQITTALIFCGIFSVCCAATNYLLFKPDVHSLFPDIAKNGMKKVLWDKLGINKKRFSPTQDKVSIITNALVSILAIAGPLVLAAALVTPLGAGIAVGVGIAALFAISIPQFLTNWRNYNAKKALMIGIIALIGFTSTLEALFTLSFLKFTVAGVLFGLAGLAAPAIPVLIGSIFIAAFTVFGFFAVFYFCTGNILIEKPLNKIKGFFKANFYDEYFSMRLWKGKLAVIGKMVFKGIFFGAGIGFIGLALFSMLSGKASGVFRAAKDILKLKPDAAFNIGRIVAFLSLPIEGMFGGKNIAKIFTSIFPKFLINESKKFYAEHFGKTRGVFNVKLNSTVKERNARFVDLIEDRSSIIKSEIIQIEGANNNDAVIQEKSRETIKTTVIKGLKERADIQVARLHQCDAKEIAQLLTGFSQTSINTLMLSQLSTDAIDNGLLTHIDKLPSSIIFDDMNGQNINGILQTLWDDNVPCTVSNFTFYLGKSNDPKLLSGQTLLIPESTTQLYFACPKDCDNKRNNEYMQNSTIEANHVRSLVLDNLGEKPIYNIMAALKDNTSIEQIVLKNLDADAIKAALSHIEKLQSSKSIEIVLDGIYQSKDKSKNADPSINNPIDTLLEFIERPNVKNKISKLTFNDVPKKFIRASEKLPKLAQEYSDKMNMGNAGNWYTRPFVHFLSNVRRMFVSYFIGTALPLNALGNSFAVITSGSGAYLDLNHHWLTPLADNPDAPTYPDNADGFIAGNEADFNGFAENYSPSDVVVFGALSGSVAALNSFSVNAVPGFEQLANKRLTDRYLEELKNLQGTRRDMPVSSKDDCLATTFTETKEKIEVAQKTTVTEIERQKQPGSAATASTGRFFSTRSYHPTPNEKEAIKTIEADFGFQNAPLPSQSC